MHVGSTRSTDLLAEAQYWGCTALLVKAICPLFQDTEANFMLPPPRRPAPWERSLPYLRFSPTFFFPSRSFSPLPYLSFVPFPPPRQAFWFHFLYLEFWAGLNNSATFLFSAIADSILILQQQQQRWRLPPLSLNSIPPYPLLVMF
jgi:hypothetical protein